MKKELILLYAFIITLVLLNFTFFSPNIVPQITGYMIDEGNRFVDIFEGTEVEASVNEGDDGVENEGSEWEEGIDYGDAEYYNAEEDDPDEDESDGEEDDPEEDDEEDEYSNENVCDSAHVDYCSTESECVDVGSYCSEVWLCFLTQKNVHNIFRRLFCYFP